MAKTDAEIVKELLDRMGKQSNDAKAREITRVLGKRIRQRTRRKAEPEHERAPLSPTATDYGDAPRYSPVGIPGEPLSSTILRDRGAF